MGASGSKASRAATGAATRQYPKGPKGPRPGVSPTSQSQPPNTHTNATRPPPPAPSHTAGPTPKPQPHASSNRSETINLDASDPDFARSLRHLGPVQPNPTLSPSSAFNTSPASAPNPRTNPAIAVLDARARLQARAEEESEALAKRGKGFVGREFLDVWTIRQVLFERDVKGRSWGEIERKMGLREGVVVRLGGEGVLGLVREVGRERREVDIV